MITVIGLGFVGLTTALGFAHHGYKVYGIEKNVERKNQIEQKIMPFYEPGLDKALSTHLNNNFFVEDNVKEVVNNSKYIFLCVGTPCKQSGEADLSDLFRAIDMCIPYINAEKKTIFIIKSTVPPSTTFGRIKEYMEAKQLKIGENVFLANNPEFLREGYSWEDFINPGRIVVGAEDEYTKENMHEIYNCFKAPIHLVTGNTAEFIKYVSNSLLATMISFSNEMAEVAENIGDIQTGQAFKILHEDERWNNCNMTSYVYPGCGYGGYCLPKDTVALSNIAKSNGIETRILDEVIYRNNNMPSSIANRISKQVPISQRIGILGLSFKPDSDDVRACISYKVINELIKLGYNDFFAYDPIATENFKKYYEINATINYAYSLDEICNKSDTLIVLTAWSEFKDIHKLTEQGKTVLDYRYMI